jgi:hypothetical protein
MRRRLIPRRHSERRPRAAFAAWLLPAIIGVLLASSVHARMWTDKSGQFSVEAEFVKVDGGAVVLKKADGSEISVALDRLSESDQKFVAAQTGPPEPGGQSERPVVAFPNAKVKLIQPEGFVEVKNFEGFHQEETQSSIVVVKVPSPYAEIAAGFTAQRLREGGMTPRSRRDVKINGADAVLMNVRQTADEVEYMKWILLFGNDKETKVVTGMCPRRHELKLSDLLRAAVMSATPVD